MIELMFVLTTVFVAYVVYSIAQETQRIDKATAHQGPAKAETGGRRQNVGTVEAGIQAEKAATMAQPEAGSNTTPQESAKKTIKPVPAPTKPKSAVTAANTPVQENSGGAKSAIRNPKTGETASLAGNYRFMKRWIKEALVDEGLLDKIYKNNELDADAEARIKQALLDIQEMEAYRA